MIITLATCISGDFTVVSQSRDDSHRTNQPQFHDKFIIISEKASAS